MPNFMKRGLWAENPIFTDLEIENLFNALQQVQLEEENYTTSDKAIRVRNNRNRLLKITTNERLPITEDRWRNSIAKRRIGNQLGDFGKSRQGLETGLISLNINFIDTPKGTDLDREVSKNLKPEREHFIPFMFQIEMMRQDYRDGRWRFETDSDNKLLDFEFGQTFVENTYPKMHLVNITTKEENKKLIKEVEKIFSKYTNDIGEVDMDRVREDLYNAEHYKNAGIFFYSEPVNLLNKENYFKLAPESFKKLMRKTKPRVPSKFKQWF